jgi:hypothetical protein
MHGFSKVSEVTSATAITGRNLAHGKRTAQQRAFVAAGLVSGRIILTPFTGTQAALVCDVNYSHIAEVLGRRPTESLAAHIARSTPIERAEAAREVGTDLIWEDMCLPSMT